MILDSSPSTTQDLAHGEQIKHTTQALSPQPKWWALPYVFLDSKSGGALSLIAQSTIVADLLKPRVLGSRVTWSSEAARFLVILDESPTASASPKTFTWAAT